MNKCDPALGVGERIERIRAANLAAAERVAIERHGKNVLVSPSSGEKKRVEGGRQQRFIPRRKT